MIVNPPAEKARVENLDFYYGATHALKTVRMPIYENSVTALIGPSGCGKTTLLRCFNRMHDLYSSSRYSGEILIQPENQNLLGRGVDPMTVRMRIGMVFQKPNPFPKSIYENVTYGLRIQGIRKKTFLMDKCEESLKRAGLWDEVKDRLNDSALALSGGQQQRLCIARALATQPELLLLDEPTSALDPISTGRIEELILELKNSMTILTVTHNMQQASRISDFTAFMYLGQLIEFGTTTQIFTNPREAKTEEYITGRFG
ncbi:MAG: phosphate ABC transporter ATP-binding protein [Bdellovibrionaceae bacterium]|nr:phosphate ABC transporter ATP-binding protein [Pseudobdellovibrionaceae bacterium]